jgi:hypothetical protein
LSHDVTRSWGSKTRRALWEAAPANVLVFLIIYI